ncbi:MAG: tetratricopeptide repeat protein [Proteobacteria bacterium]|nr:tetratricopeptide repeat protein [Pseudomonadota bacterium]
MKRVPFAATARPMLAIAAALAATAAPALVDAGPERAVQAEVDQLELQASQLGQRFQGADAGTGAQTAPQRLVTAKLLYRLGDYSQAATLFLDYVQRFQATAGYAEALYYLGDALYRQREFLGARRQLTTLVARGPGPFYQRGLARLIAVALSTGDLAAAEPQVQALARIPVLETEPATLYVSGKYHFFARHLEEALALFRSIAPGSPLYRQARYFIGACLVAQKDYAQARAAFASILADPTLRSAAAELRASGRAPAASRAAVSPVEQQLLDLTHLALGRLLYQQGELVGAAKHYEQVSRELATFDTALYETAWVYIKQQRLDAALRALDLLVLAQPDSSLVPEVSILRGNLLIRLGQWGRASQLFAKLHDRFDPARETMAALLAKHSDLTTFFNALLARDLERGAGALALAAEVPRLVNDWVKELPPVRRGLAVVGDLGDLSATLDQGDRILKRVQSVIDSPQRLRVFAGYAAAREATVELENRLAQLRQRLLRRERDLTYPLLGPAERGQLAQLARERAALDGQISKLPTDPASFGRRARAREARVAELEAELSRIGLTVANVRAQLVAVEKFFADSPSGRDPTIRQGFEREASTIRAAVVALDREADALEMELANAREAAGVGGPQELAERASKERFRTLVEREHQLLSVYRARLPNASQQELATTDTLLARCDAVDTTLRLFNAELESAVEARLTKVRVTLAEEAERLSVQRGELASYRAASDRVIGGVAHDGYREIEHRFRDLVLRSDVGVIDVSWALKEAKTSEASRLVRQQKADLQLLDDEFKEVLIDR